MLELIDPTTDIAARGEALYSGALRQRLDVAENKGKFLVIDIDTGEYEIDFDGTAAVQRARTKRPERLIYRLRIGFPATHKITGPVRDDQ